MKRVFAQIGILVLMATAVAGVYASMFAMAVTMGWGWTFFPHLMASVALVGLAAFLSWRFSANRWWAVAVGLVRWLAVLPIAYGLYVSVAGFINFVVIKGEKVQGFYESLAVLLVCLVVFTWPEVAMVVKRWRLTAGS